METAPSVRSASRGAARLTVLLVAVTVAAVGLTAVLPGSSAQLPGTKCSDGELDAHTDAPADGDRLNGTGQIDWSATGSLAGAESLSVTMKLHRASTGHRLTLMDNESKLLGTTSGSATFDTTAHPDAADYFAEVIVYAETTGCSSRAVTDDATGVPGEFVIDNDKPDDRPPANYTFTAPAIGDVRSGTVTILWEGQEVHKDTVRIEHRPSGGTWTTVVNATPDDGTYDWDTGGLSDGDHELRLTPTDTAGNVGETATLAGFLDGFGDGAIDADRWSAIGAQENGDCGYVSGPSALKFDGSQDRVATTRPLDVAGGGNVTFHLKLGNSSAPCDAVESGEGVELQYSIDDGTTWTTIASYAAGSYADFTRIDEAIPADARTEATRFRWIQPSFTGGSYDHWAIDDVQLPDASGVIVDNSDPSLALVEPSDGVVVGGNVSIAWDTTDAHPDVVELERSTDGGASWSEIRERTDDDGEFLWRTFGDARFSDWFDDGTLDTSKWTVSGASISDDCGTASGDGALKFDGSDTRSAATEALDVSKGGDVVFHLKIGSGSSPCENADSGEDVTLQYSLDGGTTWLDIATFDSEDHPTWTRIAQPIPLLAQSSSTRFRWIQDSHSGASYDHWGIDEVAIDVDENATLDGETVQLRLTPTDAAGNVGTAVTADVTLDNTDPTDYTISSPADGSLHGPTIDVNWSGTEANPGTVKLDVSADAGDTWSEIVQATPDDGGYAWNASGIDDGSAIRIRLTATDAAGNTGTEIVDVGNRTALRDAFDDGVVDTGNWTVAGGAETDDCGTAAGAAALSFNGSIDRHATTDAIDVRSGGDVTFGLRIGDGSSPCEDADNREGVYLQYSADGGSWQRITYYDPDEHGSFTEITEPIPDGARSDTTRFRWIQKSFSGASFDHWAIDDVTVNASHHRPTAWTGNFSLDTTAPTVAFQAPNGTVNGTVTVEWSTTDAHPDVATIERRPENGSTWTTIVAGTVDDGTHDWNTTNLTDGRYRVRVTATDALGNAGANLSGTITVDNRAPGPNLTAPGSGDLIDGTVTVAWETLAGDLTDVTLEHRPNGSSSWTALATGLPGTGSYDWDTSTVEDGTDHQLRVVATDVGGSIGTDRVTSLAVDNTDPSPKIVDPAPGSVHGGDVEVAWRVPDDDLTDVTLESRPEGGQWSTVADGLADTGSVTWSTGSLADGSYKLRVVATDVGGSVGRATIEVALDRTAPTVTLTEPAEWRLVDGSVDLAWSTDDAHPDTVRFAARPVGQVDWTTLASEPDDGSARLDLSGLSDGDHEIRVTAVDAVGSTGVDTGLVTVDTTAPTVTLTSPETGDTVEDPVEIAWRTDDAHPDRVAVEVSSDGGRTWRTLEATADDGSARWSVDDPDGTRRFRVRVTATDAVGHVGETVASGNFTVVAADGNVTLTVEHPTVQQVDARLDGPGGGVSLAVDESDPLEACGVSPPDSVVRYDSFDVEIRRGNVSVEDTEIGYATIVVTVSRPFMDDLDLRPDQAVFLHCDDGAWRTVDADPIAQDADSVTFAGTVSGMSPFVFGFETGDAGSRAAGAVGTPATVALVALGVVVAVAGAAAWALVRRR